MPGTVITVSRTEGPLEPDVQGMGAGGCGEFPRGGGECPENIEDSGMKVARAGNT